MLRDASPTREAWLQRLRVRPYLASGRQSIRSMTRVWSVCRALRTVGNHVSDPAPHKGAEQCPKREENQRVEPPRAVGCLTVEASTQPTHDESTDHPEEGGDRGNPTSGITDRPPEEDPPDRQEQGEDPGQTHLPGRRGERERGDAQGNQHEDGPPCASPDHGASSLGILQG